MENQIQKVDSRKEFQMATIQRYSNQIVDLYTQTLKIKDIVPTNPKWKEIRMALNCASVLIGCQQVLTNEEYQIIKKFLIDEYKDFSAEEILIAFHKVSSGKLDVGGAEHYGKLSAMYLGTVLKAFRDFRHSQIAEKSRSDARELNIELTVSDDEKLQIRKEYLEQCFIKPFHRLIETGQMMYDKQNSFTFFVMLWNRGQMKISKEKNQVYKERAMVSLQERTEREYGKRSKELKNLISGLKILDTDEGKSTHDMVREEACALYFQDYVRELAKYTTDITKWLRDMGMYEILPIEKGE